MNKKRNNQVFLPHNSPIGIRMVSYLVKTLPVLEIGCGAGALTFLIDEKEYDFLGIELDVKLIEYLRLKNRNVQHLDANKLSQAEMKRRVQVISSLPYDQSKAIILHLLLLSHEVQWSMCILMVQKEVANSLAKGWWRDFISRHFLFKCLFTTDSKAWNPYLKVDGTVVCFFNKNLYQKDLRKELNFFKALWVNKKKKLRNNVWKNVSLASRELGWGERRVHELSPQERAQILEKVNLP